MIGDTTLRRYAVSAYVQRTVVASVVAGALACASSRVPQALRGYDILVASHDSQSVELARAMKSAGYHVRDRVKGGSRPTAALIHFMFSEPGPEQPTWLHVRLADTRSGVIVGAAEIELDSTTQTPKARAQAVVQAISVPNP
ncbi:MAG TPA: hypothetical protein VN803_10735 [Gemmatimonadales bacterium]|nr:hypothetical protein [Gemmatimonadales bacterium]